MKKFSTTLIILFFFIPVITFAQTSSLTPFLTEGAEGSAGIENLINNLYALSITLAALLAVIKIIIGGVKWMMSDIVTTKQDAKNEIRTALIGLLIVISAVMVLTVINPQTTNLNFALQPIAETEPPEIEGVPSSVTMSCATNCVSEISKCETIGEVFEFGGIVSNENIIYPQPGSSILCTEKIPEEEGLEDTMKTSCKTLSACLNEQLRCLNRDSNGGIYPEGGIVTNYENQTMFLDHYVHCQRSTNPPPANLDITLSCDGASCDDAEAACFADWNSTTFTQKTPPENPDDRDEVGSIICTFESSLIID